MGILSMSTAAETTFSEFDVNQVGTPAADAPRILPWKVVPLDPEYAGLWVVAGDLDGDGQPDIVSAQNHNEGDVHYTCTAVAQRLDGEVLWRWGDPSVGRKTLHHDVACQIHDWDSDGRPEVIVCDKQAIVELDGVTGKERRRIPIEDGASDCLVFCNLSGGDQPSDVLVKDRYSRIWAYNREGALLWNIENPGGYRTAHQPRPMDIDGDGRDEIMAGYAMLNPDGSVRWVFASEKVDLKRGHLDCARVVRRGPTPEDWRIVVTCCGAEAIAFVDGTGRRLWELAGHHFESVDVGRVMPARDSLQLVVDIDHRPQGEGPFWIIDESGEAIGQIMTDYARQHILVDWTGDGFAEIAVAQHGALYGHDGRCVGVFAIGDPAKGATGSGSIVFAGDMTGDGVADVAITTLDSLYIYRNEHGKKPDVAPSLGTEPNFTLY